MRARYVGSLAIFGTTSFLRIDSGTVQVGLRLMVERFAATTGDGRSGLPTTAT